MKLNFKRWLSLLLIVIVAAVTCICTPNYFLYAAEGETGYAVDEPEPEITKQELVLKDEPEEVPNAGTDEDVSSDDELDIEQTAYFYAWKPGAVDTGDNYRETWFYIGTGSVKAPEAAASQKKYDDFSMITAYPENYPDLEIEGSTYTYDASGQEKNSYRIEWSYIIDVSGANNGDDVITGDNCYHVDGRIELCDPEESDPDRYQVIYEGNGGVTRSGATVYVDTQTYPAGYDPVCAGINPFIKDGAVFGGWVMKDDETRKLIPEEQTFVMPDHDVTLVAQWKMLTIDKTFASPDGKSDFGAGDRIDFDITVANTGDVSLTDVIVTDYLTGAVIEENPDYETAETQTEGQKYHTARMNSLAPGASVVVKAYYTVKEEDIGNEHFTNTASAAAEDVPAVKKETGIIPIESIPIQNYNAHMTLFITTSEADAKRVYALGEAITYTITVINDGDVALKDIVVEDELTGNVKDNGSFMIERLKPGETSDEMVVTYTVADADVKAGKVVNVATAAGKTDIPGLVPKDAEGRKEDPVSKRGASLSVIKTADKVTDVKAGDVITYTIVVYNNGDETLRDVDIFDELTGDVWRTVELAPGKSWRDFVTYTVTEADILNGSVVNVATVSGTGSDGNEIDSKSEAVTTYTEPINTDYTVIKRILNPQSEYIVDDSDTPIRYEIAITSQANVTLHNVVVKDRLDGASGQVVFTELGKGTLNGDNSVTITQLSPGETVTLNCEYTVRRADAGKNIINTAIAVADPVVPTDSVNSTPVIPNEKRSVAAPAVTEHIYTLTIHYRYASGREAAPDVSAQYLEGESFYYRSPSVAGYRPNYTFIKSSSQGMPARDVEVTVTYRTNTSGSGGTAGTDPSLAPVPVPGAAPDPAAGETTDPVPQTVPAADDDTAAPDDAVPVGGMIQADEDGKVDIIPVEDEHVPLGNRKFGKDTYCVLHYIFTMAGMVIFAFSFKSRKRCQARISELTEELENEERRRK